MCIKNNTTEEIKEILQTFHADNELRSDFLERLKQGSITRDEDSHSHFCIYFPIVDIKNKSFFIGHHIKSGLWLFNGGHLDQNESVKECLYREIKEETNLDADTFEISGPKLLTITNINPKYKHKCRLHYNIWYYLFTSKNTFKPDYNKLYKEFSEIKWLNFNEAEKLITDPCTIKSIEYLKKAYF